MAVGASLRYQHRRRERELFQQKQDSLVGRIEATFQSFEVMLRGAQGLFSSVRDVSAGQFEDFLREALASLPPDSVVDVGFGERVPLASLEDHLRRLRAEAGPDYIVQRPDRPPEGDVVFPITRVRTVEGRVMAIGWDLGQEAERREAVSRAERTRDLATTGLIGLHLDSSTRKVSGLLSAIPVRARRDRPDAAGGQEPVGFVFGSIRIEALLGDLRGESGGLRFRIWPGPAGIGQPVFSDGADWDEGGLRGVGHLNRLGRRWEIEFADSGEFSRQFHSDLPAWIFVSGVGFTVILAGISVVTILRRRDAEESAHRLRESESRSRGTLAKLEERERQLADELDRLEVTLRSIGDAVITTDVFGRVPAMNPAAESLLGREKDTLRGLDIAGVLSLRSRETGEPFEGLGEFLRRDQGAALVPGFFQFAAEGRPERTLVVSVAPLRARRTGADGRVLVLRDLTERRQLEEEQIRASRLDSVGLLAGGIAHDFNNYLTSILGNLSLARDGKGSDLEALLEHTEHGVRHAQRLTHQLLTFSKGGAPVLRPTDLRELVRETAEFSTRGSNVRCEFDFAGDVWPSSVDPAQISRVVQNLTVNAVQAMPRGGVVLVSLSNHGTESRLGGGRYVRLEVEDQGPGIPQVHLDRIFEPYFSTKSAGNGLGLATAFRIVQQHRGEISARSEPGKGSCFRILLPATDEMPRTEPPVPKTVPKGTGRVLVMDDEQGIRDVARAMLRRLGYEAECVQDGFDALQLYREAKEHGKAYDVVLLDLTVPSGLGGLETIARLREIDPEVVAVVSSGYSADPIMADHREHGFADVLPKPYRLDEMARVMERVRRR